MFQRDKSFHAPTYSCCPNYTQPHPAIVETLCNGDHTMKVGLDAFSPTRTGQPFAPPIEFQEFQRTRRVEEYCKLRHVML